MKAAILSGIRDIEVKGVPKPVVGAGEILLRVESCGVCGSDVRIFNHGNDRVVYPAVIGHEMSGVIEAVGSGVSQFRVGDRIATGADVPSMSDDWSKNGMGNLSDINYAIGYQFPGGFAQYCLLNELTTSFGPITCIPDHVNYETASLCEPLACCLNGLERCFMKAGKTVMIIGAGPIGIMLAKSAAAFGAGVVIMVDLDKNRTDQARKCSVDDVYWMKDVDLQDLISTHVPEKGGFDIVLTACSSVEAQEQAIDLVAKRGVVNLFGGLPDGVRPIHVQSNILHYKEAYLTGSHGSTPVQHKLAMSLIANARVDLSNIVTHRFSLSQIKEALAATENRERLKVVVQPNCD